MQEHPDEVAKMVIESLPDANVQAIKQRISDLEKAASVQMNEVLSEASRNNRAVYDGSSFEIFQVTTITAVQAENIRSQVKHGHNKTNLSPITSNGAKLANLGEEYGEVCRALTYDNMPAREASAEEWELWKDHFVKELIQLANLALQWAQLADRNISAVKS